MTEDDTFRKLKRIPYHEMEYIYFKVWGQIYMTSKELQDRFKEHGWDSDDFITLWKTKYR